MFRYGGRHLLPRKTTTEGLCEKDRFRFVVVEETISRSQKAFAAHDTSVAVSKLPAAGKPEYVRRTSYWGQSHVYDFFKLNLQVFNVHDGRLLYVKSELHTRNITCLFFFNPLKYLITGAKDGTSKTCSPIDYTS